MTTVLTPHRRVQCPHRAAPTLASKSALSIHATLVAPKKLHFFHWGLTSKGISVAEGVHTHKPIVSSYSQYDKADERMDGVFVANRK